VLRSMALHQSRIRGRALSQQRITIEAMLIEGSALRYSVLLGGTSGIFSGLSLVENLSVRVRRY
jgi:hypothetical protein